MATGSKKRNPSKEAGEAVTPSDEQSLLLSKQRAADYLKERGCRVHLSPTPEAIRQWNESQEGMIGLFHVTC